MHTDALASVVINFAVLQELWVEFVSVVSDNETIGRFSSVAAVMDKFDSCLE